MIYIYKNFWKSTEGNKALKCKLSIQEKLKDLRIEKGLSLQELSEQTGISRASLGNYEMVMYSKLFKINFTKMEPYEFKTFTDILQRYSDLCKPVKGNGRGKKKK